MARPGKIKEIEQREGRPIEEVLKSLYVKHGKQVLVAQDLGVAQTTVSLWLMRLGLTERTILVPRDQCKGNRE